VVTQSGNQPKLRCPFHGWSYGLDGALTHVPRAAGARDFDTADFGLLPIQTHVWGPMIWANLARDAPPFERWIEGMPQLMLSRGMDISQHAFGFDHTWEIDCNWKVFQDNTIECYHCPSSHPTLAKVLEMRPDLQDIRVGGRYWIHHTIPFREGFDGSLTTQPVAGRPFNYYYHWVFPTTYLQYAGRGFDIGSLDVVGPDRIRFRHICFLPPDTQADALAQGAARLAEDATIWEDVQLCNRVQKGHNTGVAPTARVLPEPESLLSHFQHVIVDMLRGDGSATASGNQGSSGSRGMT
jgi:phenylpropionate dioxygenase-like ring-hydroxylating dioxygenase large terminal subunit